VKENYFAAAAGTAFSMKSTGMTVEGNTFYGTVEGISRQECPNNAYLDSGNPPTGVSVFVRPNQYESGRAHIAVFNWENRDSVQADLSDVLRAGDKYEIRDAQSYFGPPVAWGTYDGRPIMLPMNLAAVAEVIGGLARRSLGEGGPHTNVTHTPMEFGAFVVIRREAGRGIDISAAISGLLRGAVPPQDSA
jgi:hypothetical protein